MRDIQKRDVLRGYDIQGFRAQLDDRRTRGEQPRAPQLTAWQWETIVTTLEAWLAAGQPLGTRYLADEEDADAEL